MDLENYIYNQSLQTSVATGFSIIMAKCLAKPSANKVSAASIKRRRPIRMNKRVTLTAIASAANESSQNSTPVAGTVFPAPSNLRDDEESDDTELGESELGTQDNPIQLDEDDTSCPDDFDVGEINETEFERFLNHLEAEIAVLKEDGNMEAFFDNCARLITHARAKF